MSLFQASNLLWIVPPTLIILALYLLKMRRRDFIVPAVFLWPDKVAEVRANSLFQKLKVSWLLVLQLLLACLIGLCLAQPQLMRRGLTGQTTVVVIDSSLTMGSTDVGPSRLGVAKDKALAIIKAANPGDRIAVIDAGESPKVVSPLAYDPNGQLRAVNSVEQKDCRPSVGEAMRIAAALVGSNSSGRIVLLSDGVFGQIDNFNPGKASVAFENVGKGSSNLSINALGASEAATGQLVLCGIKNSGDGDAAGTLHVYADGGSVYSEKVNLAAGKAWTATFTVPPKTNIIQASLDAKDDLAADNLVTISAARGSSLKILLVEKEDPFTERALILDPRVSLDRATAVPESERSAGSSKYDIVIFDGVQEEPVATRGVLVLGSSSDSGKTIASGSTKNPTFISQKEATLMRGVDFSQVGIVTAQKLSGDGQVLASASSGPLILASKSGQHVIHLAFKPLDSDFPLQPSFPIFISNCLDYLGEGSSTGPLVVRPEAVFALPAKTSAELITPNGEKKQIALVNGSATIHGLDRTGHYILNIDGLKRDVFCSLPPDTHSITPDSRLRAGGKEVVASAAALSASDQWPWILLAALGLLSIEWFVFMRRS